MTIKALIFDLDGLLIDSETAALESWQEIYAIYGQAISLDLWKEALGRARGQGFDPAAHLAGLVAEPLDMAALVEQRQRRKHELCAAQDLLPGVRELLAEAAALGLPCAVASSSDRAWVTGWLDHHGIAGYFTCVRTADDVAHGKPAPDLFLSAAACLGLPPAACLVFEDSPNGALAAQAAGMPCVAVPCAITAGLELPPVALRMTSLAELPLAQILAAVAAGGA